MAVLILLILFALMWIVLIVPRQREVRRHRQLVSALAVGDEVMTSSGIYGTIRSLDADEVRLEVAPGLELKMARRAVAAKVPEPAEPQATGEATLAGPAELEQPDPSSGLAEPDRGEARDPEGDDDVGRSS